MGDLRTAEVYVDLKGFGAPVLMGQLHCQRSGKGELFSFEYARAWLDHRN